VRVRRSSEIYHRSLELKNLSRFIVGSSLVILLALGMVLGPSQKPAEAWSPGTGISHNFCGVTYWRWDGSNIKATGKTTTFSGYTYREYRRGMPGGFGVGQGWATQWNRCYATIGNGPNYPGKTNFKGDPFSPAKKYR